jgi:hypothetical protein
MLKWFTRSLVAMALVTAVMAVGAHATHTYADERDFTLINGSQTLAINNFYVAPSGPGEDWGADILGTSQLAAGDQAFIYFTRYTDGNCMYDMRAVFDDGSEGQLLNIDLCATLTVTFNTGG